MGWNNWLYAERLGQKEQAPKPMTNADRIRAMSDDELANIINEAAKAGWLKIGLSDVLGWLKQPAGED